MSACISAHGEYSSHEPDDEFTCALCGVLDEDALRAELVRLRGEGEQDPREVAHIECDCVTDEPDTSVTVHDEEEA